MTSLFQGRVFPEQAATPFRFNVWVGGPRRLWRRLVPRTAAPPPSPHPMRAAHTRISAKNETDPLHFPCRQPPPTRSSGTPSPPKWVQDAFQWCAVCEWVRGVVLGSSSENNCARQAGAPDPTGPGHDPGSRAWAGIGRETHRIASHHDTPSPAVRAGHWCGDACSSALVPASGASDTLAIFLAMMSQD